MSVEEADLICLEKRGVSPVNERQAFCMYLPGR